MGGFSDRLEKLSERRFLLFFFIYLFFMFERIKHRYVWWKLMRKQRNCYISYYYIRKFRKNKLVLMKKRKKDRNIRTLSYYTVTPHRKKSCMNISNGSYLHFKSVLSLAYVEHILIHSVIIFSWSKTYYTITICLSSDK